MKALEATHLSTKIAAAARESVARRATNLSIARGRPRNSRSAFEAVITKCLCASVEDAQHFVGTTAGEAFAKNIEMGEFSSMSDQESKEIYKNMHKATKEAMVGAGMGTEKAHEHTSNIVSEIVALHTAKSAARDVLSKGGTHEEAGTAAVSAAKDTVSVVTAVNGSTDEPTEADLSAIRSIGAHAAADIVAHDAASNDNNADLVQAAAMKAHRVLGCMRSFKFYCSEKGF